MAGVRKVLIATVSVLLLIAGALAAGWFRFVSAPSPDTLCRHIIEVTVAEAGQQGMTSGTQSQLIDRLRDQCVQHKQDKLQLRGRIAYASYARCIMEAETLRAIEDC